MLTIRPVKAATLTLCPLILLLAGCFNNNTDSLREHTADATAAAKRDATAIAKGVAEGLARKGPLNINKASARDLAKLPGMNPDLADDIVDHRPYANSRDLVRKHILPASEYNRIKAQIVVE